MIMTALMVKSVGPPADAMRRKWAPPQCHGNNYG
jgi:hypothetical protein